MTTTAASINHRLPESPVCAETWRRAEKVAFPESNSTQPEFLPLGESGGDSSTVEQNYTLSTLQHPTIPSLSKRKRLLSGEVVQSCTPWRTKEYTCDPPGLHEEICDFYSYMQPRPSEVRMRSEVIMRVMHIILNRWPHARVEVFGSFITGMFLPTSDIDLVVFGQWSSLPLFSLEDDFKMADIAVEGSILVLDKTSVPIIKFIDKITEVKVDISFNQDTGLKSAELTAQFIQQYPILPKLVLILKQFLTQRQLNEVYYGGISSYSLILLIVSFLQLHPRSAATESNPNLGVLLIEFFELYGRNFNYMKTGISVLNGGQYFPKEDVQSTDGSDNSLLYIIDPTSSEENANASRGCYGMWQVKQAFEHAFLRLHSAVISRDNPIPKRDSLLGAIIKVTQEVDEYRNWVDSNWPQHPLSPPTANPTPFYYPILPVLSVMPPYIPVPQPYATISQSGGSDPSVGGHVINHVITTSSSVSVPKTSTGTSTTTSTSSSNTKDESSNS